MIFCKLGRDGLDEPNMSFNLTSRDLRHKAVMITGCKSGPVDGNIKTLRHIIASMIQVVRKKDDGSAPNPGLNS